MAEESARKKSPKSPEQPAAPKESPWSGPVVEEVDEEKVSEYSSERSPDSDIMRMVQEEVRMKTMHTADAVHHGGAPGSSSTALREEEAL